MARSHLLLSVRPLVEPHVKLFRKIVRVRDLGPAVEEAFVVAKPKPNGSPQVLFQLKRNLCGKEISAEEVERLMELGRTGLIEGFVSKRGSNFSAYLILSKDKKKAEFEFPPR